MRADASAVEDSLVLCIQSTKTLTLNPLDPVERDFMSIYDIMYDGLMSINDDYLPETNLAEDYSVSPNGKTWTFKLKKDLKFSDGTDLKASDVVATANYILDKAKNNSGYYLNLKYFVSSISAEGDYILLDRAVEGYVSHTVFQLPTKLGKGVLVTPTVHGNTIVGPTAVDIEDKESTATTAEGIDSVIAKSALSIKDLPTRQVITSFAGLRAHEAGHEFIIGEAEDAEGFFNCAGIASPGLSAAPAIGRYIAGLIRDKLELSDNTDFIAQRRDILDPKKLSVEERNALIKEQPAYGTIVCRCESVTEGEIIDAIKRPVGARSLDGVKRRTRAGMGRCQSGFCSPRVMEILHRELGIDLTEVTKSGGDSYIVNSRTKDGD